MSGPTSFSSFPFLLMSYLAINQGRTVVNYSAQRKHFLWCTLGGYQVSVTRMAQDELRSGWGRP